MKFEELGVSEIDIRRFIADVFECAPVIGIPTDEVGLDLKEWARTIKADVRLWIIRKLARCEDSTDVM